MSKQATITFIVADAVMLLFAIKWIFEDVNIFLKSIKDHFYPWDLLQNKRLDEWAARNEARHKINILYAVAFALAAANWLVFQWLYV